MHKWPQLRRLPSYLAACVCLVALLLAGTQTTASTTPLPTRAQLAWQHGEIMALIHFNMYVYIFWACNIDAIVARAHAAGMHEFTNSRHLGNP